MNMTLFFEIIDGKKKQYKFAKGEFAIYEDISTTLWGGIPHDVNWAINLPIYMKALENYKVP